MLSASRFRSSKQQAKELYFLGAFCNLRRPHAVHAQCKNLLDNGGSFFIHDPPLLVLRVFLVTVNGTVGGGLAGFSLDADGGFLLAAQVAQIPLVHDVEEGGKLVAVLVIAVHAVGNRHKVNMMLTEEYLRVKPVCR